MRKIIVLSMITLDGVLQSPGSPQEDTSGNFEYGGWIVGYGDEAYKEVLERELRPSDYLLGRKTFQIWEAYWPQHTDFWPSIHEGTKYVLSNTLDKSGWKNSIFLQKVEDIIKLKSTEGTDLQVWGSSELVKLLLEHDLVDELWLKIYPLTLGKGKKLFGHGTIPAAFAVVESSITPSGVVIVYYKRAGNIITGTIQA
ncbi:MAG TPA: dihydrofolate reductase family protein [Cytophagales bacterium]|nr:dihydrofolate reductase family protein [Cytophagales bacterium]